MWPGRHSLGSWHWSPGKLGRGLGGAEGSAVGPGVCVWSFLWARLLGGQTRLGLSDGLSAFPRGGLLFQSLVLVSRDGVLCIHG